MAGMVATESLMMFYKQLDFPIIPESLYRDEFIENEQASKDTGYGTTHYENGVAISASRFNYSVIQNNNLIAWLSNTLQIFLPDSHYTLQHQTPGTHIVHSDLFRMYAIMYTVDPGGKDVCTNWYQETNKPLSRTRNQKHLVLQSDTGVVDYKDLTLLESAVFEQYKWYLFRTDVLHDVKPISEIRRSITVGIKPTQLAALESIGLLTQ